MDTSSNSQHGADEALDQLPELSDHERAVYQWQMWVDGFGELGQRRLKNASVMISRLGGVGGTVAYQLAAAGVGKLVLAHAGDVKPSDLNRQLLMTHDWIGRPRIESIQRRLLELNPRLKLVCVAENMSDINADDLLSQADLVVECAPLFPERFAMNDAAVRQRKPMVECAMYELEARLRQLSPVKLHAYVALSRKYHRLGSANFRSLVRYRAQSPAWQRWRSSS